MRPAETPSTAQEPGESVAPLPLKLDKSDPLSVKNIHYVQGGTKNYYLVPRMAFSKDFRKATRGLGGAIGVVRDLAIPDLICSWPG